MTVASDRACDYGVEHGSDVECARAIGDLVGGVPVSHSRVVNGLV